VVQSVLQRRRSILARIQAAWREAATGFSPTSVYIIRRVAALAGIAGLCLCAGLAGAAAPGVVVRSAHGDYEDVKERVVMAIENRGMVVDHTAHVGAMLERTGKDIGRDRRIYLKADVIEFCSAGVSRATMEADPRNLVFCPYAVGVYVLPDEPQRVYVIYRKPPATGSTQSVKALKAVGTLLDGIVREALK
jgi:uncharacterized protein (DUF302 family)